ncbi:MAG: nitronate monooxygenase [Flavobacteriales bacterium]|nr:nitronate monooxygenase [Flavobacteriales bacterium]
MSSLAAAFRGNEICRLLGIEFPVIQAGMVWCSGWRLAAAVSEAGGLGLIGSGSMDPHTLQIHIDRTRQATQKPFGVNVPLIYSHAEENLARCLGEGVPIVFTSAGNPASVASRILAAGVRWIHVVSSVRFARKAVEAGCHAVVAEGFEAGGHNGREETTTLCLVPMVADAVSVPVIAAGGIADGRSMAAAFALGAKGVQVGTRFASSLESSAHEAYKQAIVRAGEGDTDLTLKALTPVRMIKNRFYEQVREAQSRCASVEELRALLGRGRSRRGIFEGDLDEGELEAGQVSARIHDILPAAEILHRMVREFLEVTKNLGSFSQFLENEF